MDIPRVFPPVRLANLRIVFAHALLKYYNMSYWSEEHQEKAIGQKQWLVPGKLLKITYKKGMGKHPQPGDTIIAYTKCELINGNEIYSRALKQFTIGRNRLIEGLEIAFKDTLQYQKFTLMVSPQYAYLYNDTETNEMFPINEKLIFEFEIQSIKAKSFKNKDRVDKILEISEFFKKVDQFLELDQPYKAIKVLDYICDLVNGDRALLVVHDTAIMKKANILMSLERYEDALKINEIAFKSQSEKSFIIHSNILLKMKNKQKSKEIMRRYNNIFGNNHRCRRVYVEYLKQVQDFQALRELEGYDFLKDRIVKIVYRERDFYPFLMRGFF